MKSLKEFKNSSLNVNFNLSIQLTYLMREKLDFDVFLPSKNCNLQRELVWTLDQKRELIMSMILERSIPNVSLIRRLDDTYEVIDGKQRLSAMIDFINNKFTILIDDDAYFLSELTEDYQLYFNRYWINYNVLNESVGNALTDADKIEWFYLLNFAGTEMDKQHLLKLRQ